MKHLHKTLITLFAALMLTACGGGSSSSSNNKNPSPQAPSCEETSSCEPEPEPDCEETNTCEPVVTYDIDAQTSGNFRYQQSAAQTGLQAAAIFLFSKGDTDFAYVAEVGAAPDMMDLVLYQFDEDELVQVQPEVRIPAFTSEQQALGFAISPDASRAVMPTMASDGSFVLTHYDIKGDGRLELVYSTIEGSPEPAYQEASVTFTNDNSLLYLAIQDESRSGKVSWYKEDEVDKGFYFLAGSWNPPANTIINSLGFSNDGEVVYATLHGDTQGLFKYTTDANGGLENPYQYDLGSLMDSGLDRISVLDNNLYLPLVKNAWCNNVGNGDNSNASLLLYRLAFDPDMNIDITKAEKLLDEPLGDYICQVEIADNSNSPGRLALILADDDDGTIFHYQPRAASAEILGTTTVNSGDDATLDVIPDVGASVVSVDDVCAGGYWDAANSQYLITAMSADCTITFNLEWDD